MGVKIRHMEVLQKKSAVGMRVGSHASVAGWGELGQLWKKTSAFIEQFLWLVASHPALEVLHMIGMLGVDQNGYLVSPERSLDFKPIDDLRSRPALGRS